MSKKPTQVKVDVATMDFVTGEIHMVHALCDRVFVPREIDGMELSMAQRVAILEGAHRNMTEKLGMTPPVSHH